jgi:hypothetical protein
VGGLLDEPVWIFVVLLHNDAKSSLQGTKKVAKLQKMTGINIDLFSARTPMPLLHKRIDHDVTAADRTAQCHQRACRTLSWQLADGTGGLAGTA